jgi:hypothetical protein
VSKNTWKYEKEIGYIEVGTSKVGNVILLEFKVKARSDIQKDEKSNNCKAPGQKDLEVKQIELVDGHEPAFTHSLAPTRCAWVWSNKP